MTRLKSEIWIQAYLRRWFSAGGYGAVLRKGAPEAGAVYIVVNRLDGTMNVFGPAPGPAYDDQGDRRWAMAANGPIAPPELSALIEKLSRIDPDIWVIEIEDRSGTGGLSLARDI
jgi:hypothetical protein